jgi:DNA polymerase
MQNKHLARQLVQRMESLRRAGVTLLPKSAFSPTAATGHQTTSAAHADATLSPPSKGSSGSIGRRVEPSSPAARSAAAIRDAKDELMAKRAAAAASTLAAPRPTPPTIGANGAESLDEIRREVAVCTKCRELACTRTQTVFGVGNPQARLCFLGEAPGADEDRQGEPFVGRAGQLLNKIIEACTLRREDVYILNILKCRPPGNRNPEPQEAANCRPFLDRQLALVKPEFICCLGAVAARNLLNTETSIGKLRGRTLEYGAAKVVCTYHPAYLLRNPAAKRDTWEDMQMLMKLMGIELPK